MLGYKLVASCLFVGMALALSCQGSVIAVFAPIQTELIAECYWLAIRQTARHIQPKR